MRIRRKAPERVAILGAGPAGMFAAHAFAEAGWEVVIFSRDVRSQMFGAQYLHEPIPGLPQRFEKISYELLGTVEEYRRKVYGNDSPGKYKVSPDKFLGQHMVADIRAAYLMAWDKYSKYIEPTFIGEGWYASQFHRIQAGREWRAVISTVPAPVICANSKHNFHSQKIWAAGDAPELNRFSPVSCPPGKVICNGTEERAWYRVSNIFGHTTCEWPHDRKPPVSGISEVPKPLWTDCDCHKNGRVPLYRLGRYGKWDKNFLSHEAFEAALKLTAVL